MNDFEKKLFADLQSGHSVDSILAEFNKCLKNAQDELEAEKKKKAEEEARAKAEAEKARQKNEDAKTITELANRALNNKITSADVAWMFQRYMAQKYNKSEEVCKVTVTAEDVDSMIDTAVKMFTDFEPMLELANTTWDELVHQVESFLKSSETNKKSEDTVLREFLNKIL